ncbi:MAG: tRNA lysidine(34) synthetase TilS [Rhodospirillales bacterium]|nr:tRNA lysidine(34) synthetase TilS [Rhodospirillales bacterium]
MRAGRDAPPVRPISASAFDALMADLGPYEQNPCIAVAVSGGRDSMALAFLAHRWAVARGGKAIGLTVDHRLRSESADEAASVSRSLARWGMGHRTLRWDETPPAAGVQAAARAARYELMEEWCRGEGVLHLALAHHREDQIETHWMRAARPGGMAGLAGMSAIRETPRVRLLRPLLSVPRECLTATLEAEGVSWIEDPSNEDTRYERVRVRARLDSDGGAVRNGLWESILAAGEARIARESEVARIMARCVSIAPAGYALVDTGVLLDASPATVKAALARLVFMVGGRPHGPRQARLESLYDRLRTQAADLRATLAGCRVSPLHGRLLFCREDRNIPVIEVAGGMDELDWDGRFRMVLDAPPGARATLRSLGQEGLQVLRSVFPEASSSLVPPPVRGALPSLWDDKGLLAAPHFDYERGDEGGEKRVRFAHVSFRPRNSAVSAGFRLVSDWT